MTVALTLTRRKGNFGPGGRSPWGLFLTRRLLLPLFFPAGDQRRRFHFEDSTSQNPIEAIRCGPLRPESRGTMRSVPAR